MKKLKLIITPILTLCLVSLIIVACSTTEEDTERTTNLKEDTTELKTLDFNENVIEVSQNFGDYVYLFRADKSSTEINSKLTILNTNKDVIYETNYIINSTIDHYKLDQSQNVIDIANNLNFNLNLSDYQKLNINFQSFFKNIIAENYTKKYEDLVGSIFFHNAIISSKERSLESNSDDCGCTLHPGYLLERNGFFCQEDFIIDVDVIKKAANNNKEAFSNAKSIALMNYIKTTTEQTISFDKLYGFYVDKDLYQETLTLIKTRNKDNNRCAWWCPLGCGSDWGCCGNYSGCCLYTNPICLIHDAICTNCEPETFCLPGCVPDN